MTYTAYSTLKTVNNSIFNVMNAYILLETPVNGVRCIHHTYMGVVGSDTLIGVYVTHLKQGWCMETP